MAQIRLTIPSERLASLDKLASDMGIDRSAAINILIASAVNAGKITFEAAKSETKSPGRPAKTTPELKWTYETNRKCSAGAFVEGTSGPYTINFICAAGDPLPGERCEAWLKENFIELYELMSCTDEQFKDIINAFLDRNNQN